MAQPQHTQLGDEQEDDKRLKYLDFIEVAAMYMMACFYSIYEYAKDNSGPLKTGVQTVEATVKTVISPVYDRFQDVPFQLLKFVDRKVEHSLGEFDRHVLFLLKHASSQVIDTAKNMYTMYEPVAEHYVVSAWRELDQLPMFHGTAQMAVPSAAYWSDRYNKMVYEAADGGYPALAHLPFIPVERIAKVFDDEHHCNGAKQ
ncbi:Rubber elongation factor protein (REF) [Euphorbia peplus]|nr:Rubber elongation factor protein (REF) [Euphorbia peplus]